MSEIKTTFNVKDDGFCGELFKSEKELCPNKALIVCSGSDGNAAIIKDIATCYQNEGITSLGLSFYNTSDTSDVVCEIPLDYIEAAAKYLKSIGYEKIGIWGVSMGAAYVLLGACYYPDLISYVVAASPLYFVYEAIDKKRCKIIKGKSAFSYKGKPVPFEPCITNMNYFTVFVDYFKNFEFNFSSLYEPLIDKVKEDHIIPVEKMKARALIISGKMDIMWPAYISGEKIVERLKEKNYTYPYEHLSFEHGSHVMVPVYLKYEKYSYKANRQYPEDNLKYKKIHLDKVIEGFKAF